MAGRWSGAYAGAVTRDPDTATAGSWPVGLSLAAATCLFILLTRDVPLPEVRVVERAFGLAPQQVATVHLGIAVVVLGAWCALLYLLPFPRWRRVGLTQVPGVVVFLVALLNDIRDVSSLVPLFAIAAGAALLRDASVGESRNRTVYSLAAGIGIVPWGVVAWAQVGALLTGVALDPAIRVATVALLALAAVPWIAAWRGWRDRGIWEVASVAALAVLAVVLGVVSAGS